MPTLYLFSTFSCENREGKAKTVTPTCPWLPPSWAIQDALRQVLSERLG